MAVLWLLLRDPLRAGLLTTVSLIGFFAYGHVWNAASSVIDSQWPLIIAWALAVGVAAFAAWHAGRLAGPATRGLNLIVILALLLNVGSLAESMVALGAVAGSGPTESSD